MAATIATARAEDRTRTKDCAYCPLAGVGVPAMIDGYPAHPDCADALEDIIDMYGTLWRAWCALQDWRPNATQWDPNAVPVDWPRWRRIHARYEREYDRAEHQTHGRTFRPLWCAHCQEATG